MVTVSTGTEFLYVQSGVVNLPFVGALLVGSGLGARMGYLAWGNVERNSVHSTSACCFPSGVQLSPARCRRRVWYQRSNRFGDMLIFGATVPVNAVVGYTTIQSLRNNDLPAAIE